MNRLEVPAVTSNPETRKAKILLGIDFTKERGLEIGPLATPLVLKTEGEILYLDHTDAESLKVKYAKADSVNKNQIVQVDRICPDGDLKAALANDAPFDYILASHVVEHVPDPLSWLNDLASLLKEGGTLRLAIPDHRFTFDILRRPTALSEFITYSAQKLKLLSSMALTDSLFYSCLNPHPWGPDVSLTRTYDFHVVQNKLKKSLTSSDYIDEHNSVFDPSSFLRLMTDLCTEGLIPYFCREFFDTQIGSIEFVVILEKRSRGSLDHRPYRNSQVGSFKRFLKSSPLANGEFMRHRDALYLVADGYKRYISHIDVLHRLIFRGYKFSEAKVSVMEDSQFNQIMMGTPIYRTLKYTSFDGVERSYDGDLMKTKFSLSDFY